MSLLILLAFGLRVFRLGAQSLWADEGYGLYLASETLGDLFRDILVDLNHVPLYFLTLHGWIRVFGDGEYAVRFLSVVGGMLAVVLTYRLARVLISRGVGTVGLAMSALAPFQVYYSQEARMHIWTTAIGLLAANALVWSLDSPNRSRRWALYAFSGVAGLYTFYYAGFVLAALSLTGFAALVATKKSLPNFARFFAANLAILVAFAPWVFMAATRLYYQAEHKGKDFVTYGFYDFLNLNWKTFVAGVTAEPDKLEWPIWPLGLLLVLGVLALRRSRLRLLLPLYLALPLACVFVINLRFPHFLPRYLLLATPPFYLLLSAGLMLPFQRLLSKEALRPAWRYVWFSLAIGVAGALVLMSLTAERSLANNYFDPAYARDDYRGVAATIAKLAQPDDVVVLDAPWQIYNFPYYYRGALPIVGVPFEDPLDPALTAPKLTDIIRDHAGVWLVLYGNASMDPNGYVEQWLDEHSYKVDDSWFGTVRLAHYITTLPYGSSPVSIQHPIRRDFQGGLALLGYELVGQPPSSGEPLFPRLYWLANERPKQAFRGSLRLTDSTGRVWAQQDAEPLDGAKPTDQWPKGLIVRDPRRLDPPAGIPPGSYVLQLAVYADSGRSVTDQPVTLGTIEMAPDSTLDRIDPVVSRRASGKVGQSVRVVGADFPDGTFQAGATIDVMLVVRALAPKLEPFRLTLRRDGRDVAHGPDTLALDNLRAGEIRRIPLSLRLSPGLPGGTYELQVTGPEGSATFGAIQVVNRPRQFEFRLDASFQRIDAQAGAGIELLAAEVPRQVSSPLVIRLAWLARSEPVDDLVAFVHLVDGNDQIIGQNDAPPGGIVAPTSGWAAGEYLVDERQIALPSVKAGIVRVYAGLYRSSDGRRVGLGDGRILVGVVQAP